MLVVIDNYDSFTYNLVHYFEELGERVVVYCNDRITAAALFRKNPAAIVLSPGPGTPDKAGICLDVVREFAGKIPLLGVCLGHQAIGEAFGGRVVRAATLMHGKISAVSHDASGVFTGIPSPFRATRYHSLTLDPDRLPSALEVAARSEDGTIMGIRHRTLNIHGVQFHPESIASEHGHRLLKNFLALARKTPLRRCA